MQTTTFQKTLSFTLCIVLIAAMALCITGCNGNDTPATGETVRFTFTVVDTEGKETAFDITTDKTLVGEALQDEGLIAGEEGEYGLYVKTVNGITLDYEKDGYYWSFYVDGEYGLTGVDQTEITPGATYTFKAESAG